MPHSISLEPTFTVPAMKRLCRMGRTWHQRCTQNPHQGAAPRATPRLLTFCFMHLSPGVVHNFPKAVGV